MIFRKNNISQSKWESFISKNSLVNPFQSPAFFYFYNSITSLSAQAFAIEESDELLALCVVTFQKEKGLKAYFSRRAIIYGGPIITNDPIGSEALTFLLESILNDLKHKVIYIETRNFNDYSDYKDCFASQGWHYEPYLDIQLSLEGKSSEDILGAMKYNRRREINLSLKEGATCRPAENTEEVMAIYDILKDLYKQRVNRPMPSHDFFIKLFQSETGKVFVVLHNQKVIGGSFCIYYPQNSIYTMYYCGLRDYHARIFPTHLAIWAAIDFGVKNKLKKIDLMGAGKPGIEYGVRKYKAEFGGEMVEHGRFLKVCNPVLYSIGKMGLLIMKKVKK
jgi:serine/alanine adding enzyme